MKVAVLGSGPAGLMAAQGAMDAGAQRLDIYALGVKSTMYGAQYLHKPIPGVTPGDGVTVDYRLQGSVLEYREKVYGRLPPHLASSVESLGTSHSAWDIRGTYDRLWDAFQYDIIEFSLDWYSVHGLLLSQRYDVIISSVPAPAICDGSHEFRSEDIYAAGEALDRGIRLDIFHCPDNTVICNGLPHPSWYRLSNVFGVKTVEWPIHMRTKPPIPHAIVRKPLTSACDCHRDVVRVGRYGQWRKGALSHEAYDIAKEACSKVQGVLFDA